MENKMDKLSSNNLMIVMLLISLLVIGVSGLAAKTLFASISRNNAVVQKKVAAEKALKTNIDNAPGLIDSFAELGTQKNVLADALPEFVDFPSILVTAENMAGAAGQRLKSVTPSAAATATTDTADGTTASTETAADSPAPVPYTFGIITSGDYAGMLRLLKALELSARPMRVLDVQYAGDGADLTSTFTVQTYYQEKAELPFSTEVVK